MSSKPNEDVISKTIAQLRYYFKLTTSEIEGLDDDSWAILVSELQYCLEQENVSSKPIQYGNETQSRSNNINRILNR